MSSLFDGLADIFADTFGQDVVYTPVATGTPATIKGIVRVDPILVDLSQNSPQASAQQRRLDVRVADVASPAEGDQVAIGSDTFKVVPPIEPDGQGMVTVFLEVTS